MVNGPPGTSTSRGSAQRRPVARRRRGAVSAGAPLPQLMGDEHGLVVLLLMLGDHAERERRR